MFSSCVFIAEGVQLVNDFGAILERVNKPALGSTPDNDVTIQDALLMFMRYYETNETFDVLTHGIGPGVLGLVIHLLIEFLGTGVCSMLADSETDVTVTPIHLSTYVAKLRQIVATVVVDATDPVSGKLVKTTEEKCAQKKKVKTRTTERKPTPSTSKLDTPSASDEDASDDDQDSSSCTSGEADFTTLKNTTGLEYKPMSKKKEPAKFGVKRNRTRENTLDDLIARAETMKKTYSDQKSTIARLKREKAAALKALDEFEKSEKDAGTKEVKEMRPSKKKKTSTTVSVPAPSPFVTDSLEAYLGGDSDGDFKPDSTYRPRKGSDGSIIIEPSQFQKPPKRKRQRIPSSESGEPILVDMTDAVLGEQEAVADSQSSTTDLRRQRDELQGKYEEMRSKMFMVEMENRARDYTDHINASIRTFREALMNAFGEDLSVCPAVVAAKEALRRSCVTVQYMGYTFRVGIDFVDRVETSILGGQIPEKSLLMTKDDNSRDDCIQGPVVDVVFEYQMPIVVKTEKTEAEDDDLQIVMVAPADTTRKPTAKLSRAKKQDNDATAQVSKEEKQRLDEQRGQEEEAERQRLAEQRGQEEEAEKQRLAEQRRQEEEAEKQRLAEQRRQEEEAEKQRLAEQRRQEEEAEKQRLAEQRRQEEEAEKQRLAEQRRQEEEAEKQRLAEQRRQEEEAEKQRLAEQRRQEEEAAEQQRLAEQRIDEQHIEAAEGEEDKNLDPEEVKTKKRGTKAKKKSKHNDREDEDPKVTRSLRLRPK